MATAVFTISLDQPAAEPAYVKWATVDGSASCMLNGRPDVARAEYTAARGYAVFAPGESQATVEIEVTDSVTSQQSLTLYLVLYDAYNCIASPDPVKCVISYNGSTTEAPGDDIDWYLPTGVAAQVDPLPDFFVYNSFSGPENARWASRDNPLARFAQWMTEPYARYYGERDLQCLRQCSAWDLTQNNLWGDLDPISLRMLRRSMFLAQKYGMTSLLSQHSNSMFALDGCVAVLGDGIFTERAFADTITKIVGGFADIQGFVGTALNSEPWSGAPGLGDDVWWRFAAVGLAAVRAINNQIYVAIDASTTGTLWNWATHNAGLATMRDPAGRAWIVSDIYLDSGTGAMASFWDDTEAQGDAFYYSKPVDQTLGPRRLELIIPWLRQNGWRLMIGESGFGWYDAYNQLSSAKWSAAADAYARACRENGVVLGLWTSGADFNYVYDVGDGLYLNRYPYITDPIGSSNRYGPYETGPEAPPFAAFRRWFGPDESVGYALKISATVTGGTCAVQCVAGFLPPWPVDATVDDAGMGGTVAGAIQIDAGMPNQARTVTYTAPAGACAVTIGLDATANIPVQPAALKLFLDQDLFPALGLSPSLVVWPVRLVKGYAGPCVTLLRSDGQAQQTFGFTLGGSPVDAIGAAVDASAVAAWDAGTPLVVRYHDQSGNGRDLGPYQGEDCQWSEDGSRGPDSTSSDYPRYMLARDVPYLVPHFGGDFGDYDVAARRANRMDVTLPIDGALTYSWVVAFGANIAVGQDDYIACYSYAGKNFVVGPNGIVQAVGAMTATAPAGLDLNNLNIVEVYYTGGGLLKNEAGTADNTTSTLPDGTVIAADLDAGTVAVTTPGGTATVYQASVAYPGSQYDLRWQDSDGHYNRLLAGWGGDSAWTVTDGNGRLTCWLNGAQTISLPAAGFLLDPYNGVLNIGWNRFYLSVTVADLIGVIAIPGPVTAAQRGVLYHSLLASLATGSVTGGSAGVGGVPGSVMHVDGAGNLVLDVDVPGTDPAAANALWTQGGSLMLSRTGDAVPLGQSALYLDAAGRVRVGVSVPDTDPDVPGALWCSGGVLLLSGAAASGNAGSVTHVDTAGHLIIDLDLPTADPRVKNALWMQGGILLLSVGTTS